MLFTIGCDPEVFVGSNNGVHSIIGKIGGSKESPLELPLGKGFCVQEDNVAMGFNIPPANDHAEFIHSLAKVTGFLEDHIKNTYGYHFVKDSAVSFPDEELYDPSAHVFGCDPDINCWTGRVNPRPKADDPNLRSCGGHVHIGVDGLDWREVGKGCDLVLGVPSVLMDNGQLRKKLYGKAGAVRRKSFGVEYRVLSKFWIFSDELRGWVYDGVERVLDMVSAAVS